MAYAVSDNELGVAAGVAAMLGYVGAIALLGAGSGPRWAFAIVLTESALAMIAGMAAGGFDNEAWGASIVLLTLIAAVTLAAVAAAGVLRSAHRLGGRQ